MTAVGEGAVATLGIGVRIGGSPGRRGRTPCEGVEAPGPARRGGCAPNGPGTSA